MYRLIMAIGVVAVSCVAIGCGSSGDAATSAPLTKAQFIKRAGAICGRFQKERQADAARWLQEQAGGQTRAESHYDEGFKLIVAPSMRREAEELETLIAPGKDAVRLDRMVDNFVQASDAVADRGRQGLLAAGLKDFEREAEALRLPACADPM